MGYRSNPILLRLGYRSKWTSEDYRKYDYSLEILKHTRLYTYLDTIFGQVFFKKKVLFFSHLKIKKWNNNHLLTLYFFHRQFSIIRRFKLNWGYLKVRHRYTKWLYRRYKRKKLLDKKITPLSNFFIIISRFILPYIKYNYLVKSQRIQLINTKQVIISNFVTNVVKKKNLLSILSQITNIQKGYYNDIPYFKLILSLKNYLLTVLKFIFIINYLCKDKNKLLLAFAKYKRQLKLVASYAARSKINRKKILLKTIFNNISKKQYRDLLLSNVNQLKYLKKRPLRKYKILKSSKCKRLHHKFNKVILKYKKIYIPYNNILLFRTKKTYRKQLLQLSKITNNLSLENKEYNLVLNLLLRKGLKNISKPLYKVSSVKFNYISRLSLRKRFKFFTLFLHSLRKQINIFRKNYHKIRLLRRYKKKYLRFKKRHFRYKRFVRKVRRRKFNKFIRRVSKKIGKSGLSYKLYELKFRIKRYRIKNNISKKKIINSKHNINFLKYKNFNTSFNNNFTKPKLNNRFTLDNNKFNHFNKRQFNPNINKFRFNNKFNINIKTNRKFKYNKFNNGKKFYDKYNRVNKHKGFNRFNKKYYIGLRLKKLKCKNKFFINSFHIQNSNVYIYKKLLPVYEAYKRLNKSKVFIARIKRKYIKHSYRKFINKICKYNIYNKYNKIPFSLNKFNFNNKYKNAKNKFNSKLKFAVDLNTKFNFNKGIKHKKYSKFISKKKRFKLIKSKLPLYNIIKLVKKKNKLKGIYNQLVKEKSLTLKKLKVIKLRVLRNNRVRHYKIKESIKKYISYDEKYRKTLVLVRSKRVIRKLLKLKKRLNFKRYKFKHSLKKRRSGVSRLILIKQKKWLNNNILLVEEISLLRYLLITKRISLVNLNTFSKLKTIFKFKYFINKLLQILRKLTYRSILKIIFIDIVKILGIIPIIRILNVKRRKYHPLLVTKFIVFRLLYQFRLGEVVYPIVRELAGIFKHKRRKGRIKRGKNRVRNKIKGIMLICSGRFTRKQRATRRIFTYGNISHGTFRSKVEYAFDTARLRYGMCGIKMYINYKK